MKIFGVEFAPLNVPFERRLQTLAAGSWFIWSAFGNFIAILFTAYLLIFYTQSRYFLPLYALWMYYDRDTCNQGGRSYTWTKISRKSIFWRYFCDYFPIKLVKTVDLDPMKSYLFICIPHGILSVGVAGALGTDNLDSNKLFPGLDIRPIVLDQHFKIPFYRDYAYFVGCCAARPKSIKYLLSSPPKKPFTGRATVLIVGGASESLESRPGVYRILLKKRKGFVKLALRYGTPLVPVFSFGETDLFNQLYRPEGSLFRRFQHYVRNITGVAPVFLSGRGFFQYTFGLIPKRAPVTVVVGSPIELPKIEEPTTEQINEYHEKFVKHLVELFETHKYNYLKDPEKTVLEFEM